LWARLSRRKFPAGLQFSCCYVYGLNAEKSLAEPLVIEEVQIEGMLKDWVQDESSGRGFFFGTKACRKKRDPRTAETARRAGITRTVWTARTAKTG
jgi:hypothetical protein